MTVTDIAYMVWHKTGTDNDTLPRSTIVSMLNSLLHEWAKFFPDTYHETDTGTLSADATTITLPSDFREFDSFWIDNYKYDWIPYADVNEYGIATSTANTKVCYYSDATFNFYPGASAGDEYTLYYFKTPTEVTAMSDEPEIPEEYHHGLATVLAYRLAPKPDALLIRDHDYVYRSLKRNRGKGRRNSHVKTMQTENKKYNYLT